MLDWLNNNPGGTAIISSAVGALMGAFFTFVGWLGGKRAGKKAAQKEIESLRIQLMNSGIIAGPGAQVSTGGNSPNLRETGDVRINYE